MKRVIKYYVWFFMAACCGPSLYAQEPAEGHEQIPDSATVAAISPNEPGYFIRLVEITGNRKTKARIILREVPFKEGETYTLGELVKKMAAGQEQLMNMALFHTVSVSVTSYDGNDITIGIVVRERWYLFPVPYFKPVDRNLNQWLFEQKGSIDRVNYGMKVSYNNVTGRNDKFRLWLMGGYTRQIAFSYSRPYFDKQMKWGWNAGFGAGQNREVNYNTINDKQVFIKDNDYIRSFIRGNAELTYRKAIKTRHTIGIAYGVEEVSDTIVQLNPDYFKNGHHRIYSPAIYYSMSYYDLDYIPYPTKGYAAQLSLSKTGLNKLNNLWQFHVKAMGAWPLTRRTFFSASAYAGIKLPFHQPYFNRRFLGYDASMQGFEYYVIDGLAGGYIKGMFATNLFNFNIKLPQRKNNRGAEQIPFRFYGKIFGNTGYVHDPQPGENLLSNKMLYAGGIGLDIVTLYDVTFRFEWTFNHLGQNGLFLHRKTIF